MLRQHWRIGITSQTNRLNFRVPKSRHLFRPAAGFGPRLVDFVEIALSPHALQKSAPSKKNAASPLRVSPSYLIGLFGQFREFRHIGHAATPFCAASSSLRPR